jgi:hypothetical protein
VTITNAGTGGEKLDIIVEIVGRLSSGDGEIMENPSSTDDPSRSEESAGLSKVAGTPSIWAMTQRHRQHAISNQPRERLEYSVVVITIDHTDSGEA